MYTHKHTCRHMDLGVFNTWAWCSRACTHTHTHAHTEAWSPVPLSVFSYQTLGAVFQEARGLLSDDQLRRQTMIYMIPYIPGFGQTLSEGETGLPLNPNIWLSL